MSDWQSRRTATLAAIDAVAAPVQEPPPPPPTPVMTISELRDWLTAAELMLRDMDPDDPKYYKPGLAAWQARLAEYEARVLAEGELE